MRDALACAVIAIGVLGVSCKQKSNAKPAALDAGRPTAAIDARPVAALDASAVVLTDDLPIPEGVDPMWVAELVAVPPPSEAKVLRAVDVPRELDGRIDARLPELIGTCLQADAEAATWVAAPGRYLYVVGTCNQGQDHRVAVLIVEDRDKTGHDIAPVGRTGYRADAISAVTISEAPGPDDGGSVVCVSGDATLAGKVTPWRTCFPVVDGDLYDRARRGRVTTAMEGCPAVVAGMGACADSSAFAELYTTSGTSAHDLEAWAKDPAICSAFLETRESYVARSYTVPFADWAMLATAAGHEDCPYLAGAILSEGGLPTANGE